MKNEPDKLTRFLDVWRDGLLHAARILVAVAVFGTIFILTIVPPFYIGKQLIPIEVTQENPAAAFDLALATLPFVGVWLLVVVYPVVRGLVAVLE